MDAHTHYPDRYLAIGAERLERGDVVCAGGPQIAVGAGRWSSRVALALTTPLGVGATARSAMDGEVDVDTVFAGMWRRDTLIASGGWDEEWINDQDFELASRLRAAGGRIVCIPEMAADYVARDGLGKLARQYWRYGHYRIKTAGRHPHSLHRTHLMPPALVVTVLAAAAPAPRPVRRSARVALSAYLATLALTAGRARAETARDAAAVPLVLATMHVSYGLGALAGLAHFGIPARALAMLLGLTSPSASPRQHR
jgi:hypothetical protein